MPKQARHKTGYPGVYYIVGQQIGTDKPEKIFYIYYRRAGKLVTEKAGRQFQDDMTPARAAGKRALRLAGREPSNRERREANKAAKDAAAGKWTIKKIFDEYKKLTPLKGLATDENRFKNHLEPILGEKEPAEIIQLDLDRLRIKLLKTRSPQTVMHILRLISRIVNFGNKRGLCSGLSFKIQMPRVDNCKTENLSQEQLAKLIEVLKNDENKGAANLMFMAMYTGMRRGELFKLQWEDVDFERGFIRIRDPKGSKEEVIPLNDAARAVLKGQKQTKSPYVFPGKDGERLTTAQTALRRIKKDAGLPADFRYMHGLRHVYASLLASSGQVDLYVLQKLLTHKTPRMTQRYAHLRDETLKQASNLAGVIVSEVEAAAEQKKKAAELNGV